MRRQIGMWALLIALATAASADAQVISLLVGNGSGFAGLDSYSSVNGGYTGAFASAGSGTEFSFFKYGGPTSNLFVERNNSVLQFNGHTGAFINTFSTTQFGGAFCFGPDNNMYRLEGSGTKTIGKYDGTTGVRLGTFVDSSMSGLDTAGGSMRFGPNGNLFVDNGNTILQFNGTTGTPMGQFIAPGSGGLTFALDALFASNGNLLVSGGNGTTNDSVYRFDGTTGAYLGVFASGNGIDIPIGLAQGPDGAIYAASEGNNQIKRFDLSTGNFIDNFIPATAHQVPTYLAFTPFPVPEPASIVLLASVSAAVGAFRSWRRTAMGVRRGESAASGSIPNTI
jgi:streptogramin lyase